MLAIFKREMRSYFTTATGYIFLAVSLALFGAALGATTLLQSSSDTSTYFIFKLVILIVILPILTMKIFSEEKKTKTEQLLLTAPVSIPKMVLGKYLAAFCMYLIVILVSMVNYIPLYQYTVDDYISSTMPPSMVMILGNTFALVLIGMAFIAIGMFISALTENQFAAIVGTLGVLAALFVLGIISAYIPNEAIRYIFSFVSVYDRYIGFTYGMFDFGALIYYLALAGAFIFLTIRVFISRRYR